MADCFPTIHFVVIPTDFDEGFPNMWFGSKKAHYLVGTKLLQDKAKKNQHSHFPLSGLILRPSFHKTLQKDKGVQKTQLGLRPDQPVALIMFGGYGDKMMLKIAQGLTAHYPHLQCIFICGHHKKLYHQIQKISSSRPWCVVEFTKDIFHYMRAADFFIGKPGPGCISEAIDQRLPVLVQTGWTTLLQEKAVVEWIERKQLGLSFHNFRDLLSKIKTMLDHLDFFQRNVSKVPENKAVFESLTLLKKFL